MRTVERHLSEVFISVTGKEREERVGRGGREGGRVAGGSQRGPRTRAAGGINKLVFATAPPAAGDQHHESCSQGNQEAGNTRIIRCPLLRALSKIFKSICVVTWI